MSQPINPPVIQTTTVTYSYFNVTLLSMIFNTSATFHVQLYDENNNLLIVKIMTMTGSDYSNWQGNDDYVYAWVNQQIQSLP
jgi:hypothetical protein